MDEIMEAWLRNMGLTAHSAPMPRDNADELLQTAAMYEKQAADLKKRAEKLKEAEAAKRWHFESHTQPVFCIKCDGVVKRFFDKADADLYTKLLKEWGAKEEDIEHFNIEVEIAPKFWRA